MDQNAVLKAMPGNNDQEVINDGNPFQLFKTFNDKRTQMGKADILVDQDKR